MKGLGDQLTDVDDAFLEIVGYSREDFERGSLNWRAMTPAEFGHLDDAGIQQAAAADSGGFTLPYRKEFLRKDGTRAPVLLCCAFIPNAPEGSWMGYVVDLSHTVPQRALPSDAVTPFDTVEPSEFPRRLIGELVRERTSLHAVFDSTPSLMWAVDRELRLLVSNAAFQRAVRGVIGREIEVGESIFHSGFAELLRVPWEPWYQRALAGEQFVVTTSNRIGLEQTGWDHSLAPIRDATGAIIGASVVSQNVTDRVRFERRANRREQELNEAQRVAEMGNWEWNPATNGTQWSEGLFRIYERDPGLGAPTFEELAQYQRPVDFERLTALVARALTDGEPYELDTRFTRRDGTTAWVYGRGEPVRAEDGTIIGLRGTVVDITGRKLAELTLRRSETELREAQRLARLGSWDWDMRTGEASWSTALREMFGLPADAPVPHFDSHQAYYTPESWQRLRSARAITLETGEPNTIDLELSAGPWIPRRLVSRTEAVRDAAGAVVGLHGITMDVTDVRETEDENRRLERQLIQSQKMQAVGQLAGGIAHDFNNLLTALLLQLSALRDEESLTESVRSGLNEIEAAADRAAALTRQLLVFSRQQALKLEPIELNRLLARFLQMLKRLIGADVPLTLEEGPAPLFLDGDTGMLEQVVMNLVVNARDAMPHGGTIRVVTSQRTITGDEASRRPGARPGNFAVLEVIDEGSGIEEKHVRHLFEPFFTTKASGKGTGLGLATAYGITLQHGGWIEFDSEVGVGSSFRVMLPIADEERAPVEPSAAGAQSVIAVTSRSERVLLVEDEPSLRRLLARGLTRTGYAVEVAEHGPDALRLWQEQRGQFDLVISDMVMPGGITGLELLHRFAEENPSVQTLLMSGYSTESAERTFLGRTGRSVLSKPFSTSDFVRAVTEALSKRVQAP